MRRRARDICVLSLLAAALTVAACGWLAPPYYQETPGGNGWFGGDTMAQDKDLDGWVDSVGVAGVGFRDEDFDRLFEVMVTNDGPFNTNRHPIEPIAAFRMSPDRPPTPAELSRFDQHVSER